MRCLPIFPKCHRNCPYLALSVPQKQSPPFSLPRVQRCLQTLLPEQLWCCLGALLLFFKKAELDFRALFSTTSITTKSVHFSLEIGKKYLHLTQQPKLGLLFLCFLEKKKSLLIKEGLKAFHFEFVFPIAPKKAQISSGLFSIISSFTLTYTLHLADIYS